MKLTKSTVAATFVALLIGGLSISPALAKVHPSRYNETGRVDMSEHVFKFELKGDTSYTTGRVGPEGTQPILKSSAGGRTNGRQG
jgi:hypothetical protein